jgi:prophage antirepressor-like protein
MNDLQTFRFDSFAVRVSDRDGEPWFVAADICGALGISDTHVALRRLEDADKGRCQIPTPGGPQEMIVVNETGLYLLVFRSQKPEAERFTRWVASEVLPALRRTGHYSIRPAEDPLLTQARLHLETVQRQVELERVQREQQGQIEELKTQVGLTSTHMTLKGWCSQNKIRLSHAESIRAGKSLAKLCREKGGDLHTIPDLKYGRVNAYPVEVLAEWMANYSGGPETDVPQIIGQARDAR